MKFYILFFAFTTFKLYSQFNYTNDDFKPFGELKTNKEYVGFSKYVDSVLKYQNKEKSFEIKLNAGEYALTRGKLSLAYKYVLDCEREMTELKISKERKVKIYWLLGRIHYNFRSVNKSISYFEKVVHFDSDSLRKVDALNYLGLLNKDQNNTKRAELFFRNGLYIAKSKKIENWVGIFQGNIAYLHYQKGQLALAQKEYEQSLETSLKTKEFLYTLHTIEKLGLIYLKLNHKEKFIKLILLFQENKDLFKGYKQHDIYKQVELLLLYGKGKNYELINSCFVVLRMKDSLRKQVDFESFQNYQLNSIQYEAYISSLKLKSEKQSILSISIITAVIFIAIVIILFISYKKLKQRRNFEKVLFEQDRIKKEKQIQQMSTELNTILAQLIDKTNLVTSLENQIDNYSENLGKSVQLELASLKESIHTLTLIKEEDLEKFEELFELVFPDFTKKLKQSFPNITKGEIRYASLLKLNIKKKNLIGILSVSDHAIRKIDLRLRKKLNIEGSSDDLKLFIDQL
jgi:tetratricopeptide (TPR) repeat protein